MGEQKCKTHVELIRDCATRKGGANPDKWKALALNNERVKQASDAQRGDEKSESRRMSRRACPKFSRVWMACCTCIRNRAKRRKMIRGKLAQGTTKAADLGIVDINEVI